MSEEKPFLYLDEIIVMTMKTLQSFHSLNRGGGEL